MTHPAFQIQSDDAIDWLDGERVRWAQEESEMARLQKECAAERNFDAAKRYAVLKSDALKMLRAVRLWLGYLTGGGYRGDAPYKRPAHWPADLAPEIKLVNGSLYLRFT